MIAHQAQNLKPMDKNAVKNRLNDANNKLRAMHMSVSLQEGQVQDLLTLPGGASALQRGGSAVLGQEVKSNGRTSSVLDGPAQKNTMLSLTNQIAFALKANQKKNARKANRHSRRQSKQISVEVSDESSEESDSDSDSDITESSDESGSGTD